MSSTQKVPTMIDCKSATVGQLKTAILNREPINGIKFIVAHPNAHLDEIFPMYLIIHTDEGKKLFSGEKTIGFLTQKSLETFSGEDGFYLALKAGYLIIGTAGGPFDEHTLRKENKSCSDLIVRYLDLYKSKDGRLIYSPFLNYVNYEDRNGSTLSKECSREYASVIRPALLADNIKRGWTAYRAGLKNQESLIQEVFGFIQNELLYQKLFVKAREEFLKLQKEEIPLLFLKSEDDKKTPVMLIVESDNDLIIPAAKNLFSVNAEKKLSVLLKINSKGQFHLSAPCEKVSLKEVIKLIRLRLFQKRKKKFPSWKDLAIDGFTEGDNTLYYHADGDTVMNGSLTQEDVDGLIGYQDGFSKDELVKIILEALNFSFPKQFANKCTKGTCIAKVDKNAKCPYYPVGFTACHEARVPKVVTTA